MTWSSERIDDLKRYWARGLSASQIAAELGDVSRNAVIGKLHRLGLSGGGGATKASPAPRAKMPRAVARARKPYVRPPAQPKPVPRVLDREALVGFVPPASDVRGAYAAVMALTDTDCRWPIGDPQHPQFRFCCAPAVGDLPYCPDHGLASIAGYSPVRGAHRDLAAYSRAKCAQPPQGKTERTSQ